MNLLTTLLSSLVNQSVAHTAAGVVPGILGNRHPSIAPYEVFPTQDAPMVVAVGNDRQFVAFCRGIGNPALADDPRFATNPDRVANIDALAEALTSCLATRTAADWFAILSPLGAPCGPVNDMARAFDFAAELELNARIAVGEGDERVTVVADPITLSRTPVTYRLRQPDLGEHTAELREWLIDGRSAAAEQRQRTTPTARER